MEFSRSEHWSEQLFPSPGDLPNPGIEPMSPALKADSLPAELQEKPKNTRVGSLSLLQGIFPIQELNWGLLLCRGRQWHPTPVLLPGKSHGWRSLVGCSPWGRQSQTRLSDFTFTFHFPALEKEMATHSSVLAWRIPGTGKPGGLPSMGSHRVGHD